LFLLLFNISNYHFSITYFSSHSRVSSHYLLCVCVRVKLKCVQKSLFLHQHKRTNREKQFFSSLFLISVLLNYRHNQALESSLESFPPISRDTHWRLRAGTRRSDTFGGSLCNGLCAYRTGAGRLGLSTPVTAHVLDRCRISDLTRHRRHSLAVAIPQKFLPAHVRLFSHSLFFRESCECGRLFRLSFFFFW
jgi:hypothetical protein